MSLSLETLVYGAIESMYASFMSSEMVYRLWDEIFFQFGKENKSKRMHGEWWLMTPIV